MLELVEGAGDGQFLSNQLLGRIDGVAAGTPGRPETITAQDEDALGQRLTKPAPVTTLTVVLSTCWEALGIRHSALALPYLGGQLFT
jgi:hypothetical protein